MSMNQKKIFFTFVNIVNYTCVQKFLNVLEFEDLEKATVSQNFDENFEFIFANKTEVIHYRLGNIRRFIDSKEDITPLVVSFRLYRDVLQRTTVMQVLTLFSHSLVFVLLENGFLLVFSLLTCSLLKKIRVWKSHLDFDRFTGMPFLVVSSNTNWLFIHTSEFIKVLRLSSSDAFQSPCFRRLLPPNSSRLSSNTKDDVKVAKAIQKGRVLNERRASRDFEDLVEYQSELSAYNHQAFFVNNAQNLDLTEEEILQYVCLLSMENEEFS